MRLFDENNLAIACIYAEARGEPYEGQCAIGEVIRTRARLKFQSDGTITGTVLAPYSFSWLNTTDPQRIRVFKVDTDDPALQQAAAAWAESETSTYSCGATSYCNMAVAQPKWATDANKVATIGNHTFFLLRG